MSLNIKSFKYNHDINIHIMRIAIHNKKVIKTMENKNNNETNIQIN